VRLKSTIGSIGFVLAFSRSAVTSRQPSVTKRSMVLGVIDIRRPLGFACFAAGVETDDQILVLDPLGDISLSDQHAGADVSQTLRRHRLGQSAPQPQTTKSSAK
jgi:predicted signal transduction protein with EAL and GGDEF domain